MQNLSRQENRIKSVWVNYNMIKNIVNINDLPSIDEVKRRSQALALLDAILMPQWEFRYFSFNCNWDGSGNEMMASMKDGSGGEYFL